MAAARGHSVEEEALSWLRRWTEEEQAVLDSIPEEQWKEIEQSLCDSIHDRGTPFTKADLERYREIVRARQTPA